MRLISRSGVLLASLAVLSGCGSSKDDGLHGTGGVGQGGAIAKGGTSNPTSGGASPSGGRSSGGRSSGGATAEGGGLADAGEGGAPQGGISNGGTGGTEMPIEGGAAGQASGGRLATGGSDSSGGAAPRGGSGGDSVGGVDGGAGAANGGTASGGVAGSSAGGSAGSGMGGVGATVQLAVDAAADAHPISPLIYGINPKGVACSDSVARFALCRLGGNRWSTYNWENNASNSGAACFQNDGELDADDTPAHAITSLVTEAGARTTLVTIPLLDYVAADKAPGTPAPACSGDVRTSTDYLNTRFEQNVARKGAAFDATPNTTDGKVSQDEFIAYLKAHTGTSKLLFTLDNQPELWSGTHEAVHPAQTTFQEVITRNVEYASMLRDAWPTAEITGWGGYGFQAFLDLQGAPNPSTSPTFLDYYLAQMQAAETSAGKRLIDYLDIHWYSEARGGDHRVIEDDSSPDVVSARVQATRSLWDPDYRENSWVASVNPVRLIPWIREKIATNYPGTRLSISEWSYGGEDHISGAIAVADALGVYGREGVGIAALEPLHSDISFALAGFAAFRNYDGAGAAFGDTSVRATSSDDAAVSIYASTDTLVAGRVVIVAINRSVQTIPIVLNVQGSATFTSAELRSLSGASTAFVAGSALSATSANSFSTSLPSYSVTVIVPKP